MDQIQLILSRWLNATPKVLMVCLIITVFLDLIFSKKIGFMRGLTTVFGQKKFWLQFLPMLAIGVLVFFDTKIIFWVQSLQLPIVTAWIRVGAHLGRWTWLYVALAYWGTRILRKPVMSKVFAHALSATLLTAVVTHGLKFLIARARPYENLGVFSWFNYGGGIQDRRGFQSFPSGDVAVVAAVAFFFFHITPSRVGRWLWLLLPLATAFSRMSLNKHWPSDTLGSWVLANAFAWLFVQLLRRDPLDQKAVKVPGV